MPYVLVRKKKGSARVSGVYRLFNKCCFRNNFCELTYKGPNFTWNRGNLLKRLDRAISNDEWSIILHLSRINSDHRLILILFGRNFQSRHNSKPFRFMASWLTNAR